MFQGIFFGVSAIEGRYVRPLEAFVLPKVGDSPVKCVFLSQRFSAALVPYTGVQLAFHKPTIPKENVYD
jgi:hypothetical protein